MNDEDRREQETMARERKHHHDEIVGIWMWVGLIILAIVLLAIFDPHLLRVFMGTDGAQDTCPPQGWPQWGSPC
jgi:hypothetical protein